MGHISIAMPRGAAGARRAGGQGRDYADVPPLKGIYTGEPAKHLDVSVDLTRLA